MFADTPSLPSLSFPFCNFYIIGLGSVANNSQKCSSISNSSSIFNCSNAPEQRYELPVSLSRDWDQRLLSQSLLLRHHQAPESTSHLHPSYHHITPVRACTHTFPHEHLPQVTTPAPENPAPQRQPGTVGTAVQELCSPTDFHADLSSTIHVCAL